MGENLRVWVCRLDHDDPGAIVPEIRSAQHALLGALDVDLEEMDDRWGETPADLGKRRGLQDAALRFLASRCGGGGHVSDQGRQVGVFTEVEQLLRHVIADRLRQVHVPLPRFAQTPMVLHGRLDVHAVPATFVERAGHRHDRRVGGTHVDVEATRDIAEGPHQHDVFAVLRVGDHGHRGIRSGWLRAG